MCSSEQDKPTLVEEKAAVGDQLRKVQEWEDADGTNLYSCYHRPAHVGTVGG
jgi:hypothetical protein